MWQTIVKNVKRFLDWTGIYLFDEFRPQVKIPTPVVESVKEEPKEVVKVKKTAKPRKPKTKKTTKG